jgi:hypothetical protein
MCSVQAAHHQLPLKAAPQIFLTFQIYFLLASLEGKNKFRRQLMEKSVGVGLPKKPRKSWAYMCTRKNILS